jgi:hypothetical protein
MADEKPLTIFVDSTEKAKHLPEYRQDLPCPTCGEMPETGYGLAGGGMGIYSYCLKCGVLVSKSTED